DLDGGDATADLAPIYPASEEVPAPRLRTLAERALAYLPHVADSLPAPLRATERLPLRRDALHALHRPRSRAEAEVGRQRLAFDELLRLQVGIARRRREREAERAPSLGAPGELVGRYLRALPFELTPDQRQALAELDADLARETPMQRLLQ